jgi:hypothetical protein
MTLGAHIDFAARYSEEDQFEDPSEGEVPWQGYETYNLEAAVISLSGEVGDNVSYVLMIAPVMPAYAADQVQPASPPNPLLDAKIVWAITDSIALNMGRYIPHTSMSQCPHMMAVHHLNDPPMFIRGGGWQFNLTPLPRYQTGIGIEAVFGPATVTWDFYDGVENNVNADTLSDVDKSKGGVIKLAVDSGNIHGGLFYLEEMSEPAPEQDNDVVQIGVELLYSTERFFGGLEYLNTVVEPMDEVTIGGEEGDLPARTEIAYYAILGANVGPVQVVFRYDFADSGLDEQADALDEDFDTGEVDEEDIPDNELVYTLGVNYEINENTTVGLNYAWRQPEEPDQEVDTDGDGDTSDTQYPNINEISLLVEMDAL